MTIDDGLVRRLWKRVEKTVGENGCWLWRGSLRNGYGQIRLSNDAGLAYTHIVSWVIANGPVPDGYYVLHECDTRTCVNPKHLFLGTHLDNMKDMREKGRSCTGVKHFRAKLVDAQIVEIRNRRSSGELERSIADSFSVSASLISMITNRKTWKHVV
jgi:hypothetical protein